MSIELDFLIKAYSLQGATISHLENKISELEAENARLKELLQLNKQDRFGKKSEASNSTVDSASTDAEKNVTVSAHVRKTRKPGRLLGTEHLPHYQKIYDLAEHEKVCTTCQNALHFIGKESTEQLEIIPLRYCVVEHVQMKYGCRQCDTITTPPKPLAPLPKAMAGASVLTDVIINKYQFHLPLYRQSKMMKNEDVIIPDNTLGNWMVKIGFAFEPIYEAMWIILKENYLQVDETPVKILEPNKKGYLWTYYAPHIGDKRGLILFELSEARSADVAKARLKSFNGLLQTDGYSGYKGLRKREGIVGLGCFTHARRKFVEVIKISGDNNGIAAQMLEKLKPLYALEARLRELNVSFRTRKWLRQKIAFPITKEIYRWLRSIKNSVPPKSKLGNAIDYTLKQWPYLVAYLRHGEAEIDTNEVENKIREVALGKKNWLFIGNKETGKIHAFFFSLIISCVLNDLNARVYIHYVMTQLHDVRRGVIDPVTLLPHTIDRKLLEAFSNEQITFAKTILNST